MEDAEDTSPGAGSNTLNDQDTSTQLTKKTQLTNKYKGQDKKMTDTETQGPKKKEKTTQKEKKKGRYIADTPRDPEAGKNRPPRGLLGSSMAGPEYL